MAKDKNIEEVVARYLSGVLEEGDREVLEAWLAESGKKRSLLRQVKNDQWMREELAKMYQVDQSAAWEKFKAANPMTESPVVPATRPSIYSWKMIAAAVLILVAAGWWYTSDHKTTRPDIAGIEDASSKKQNDDVNPGGNKAILKLADGSTIVLDNAANGILTNQGNAQVRKTDAGKLVYEDSHTSSSASVVYNTITTPHGGTYQITLPDGTRAWLNAGSSITFPTAFLGKERNIEMTGEIYLEVMKDKSKPFKVAVSKEGTQIEVLGTHFNIKAYADESGVKTTLLEGSVRVRKGSNATTIKPGEQANVNKDALSVKKKVDLDEIMGWRNGLFVFKRITIEDMLKEIARYYDIREVEYKDRIPDAFDAIISRNLSLAKVLHVIEATDLVHFKIEGRKIIVSR